MTNAINIFGKRVLQTLLALLQHLESQGFTTIDQVKVAIAKSLYEDNRRGKVVQVKDSIALRNAAPLCVECSEKNGYKVRMVAAGDKVTDVWVCKLCRYSEVVV